MGSQSSPQHAPFGTLLGTGPGGVSVFSSDYPTASKDDLPDRDSYRSEIDGHFMGYKWQCVELARRYLYLNHGYVFDDIAMAYDIFRLEDVRRLDTDARLPLRSFRNGAKRPPEPGSLIIWNEGGPFQITGHVAVVTEVAADRVRIIEQNVEDKIWPDGEAWSRELPFRRDEEGACHLSCTLPDAEILGWVIQTDCEDHAESHDRPPPDLFNLRDHRASVPAAAGWLDPETRAEDRAYVAMMGGHRLAFRDTDQDRYFRLSETAVTELKRATNELHAMFLHATSFVLRHEEFQPAFNLPTALWSRLHQSWDNRQNQTITGRFDFSVSERGIKVYEYNCDSASCHMECGRVQGLWARAHGVLEGRDAGGRLFERLVEAWREAEADGPVHIMHDHQDEEETYHALYMKQALEAAGIPTRVIRGMAGLGWTRDGRVTDPAGNPIRWVWKTWAWETALDQLRAQFAEDEERLAHDKGPDRTTSRPRLVDVLLNPEVMVFEPLWTLIPSNKAILPILWMLYPHHPYLLDSRFELTDELKAKGYVAKPIVGRCGHNIQLVDGDDNLIQETAGRFDDRDTIYQELFPLPVFDDLYVQVCTFTAGGSYGGTALRVDPSPIITSKSDLLALRIVADGELDY